MKKVILEGYTDTLPASGSGSGVSHTARIDTYAPDEVGITVDAKSPAFLVLRDINYPGWRAYVDGVAAQIYQADYLFRAVRIESAGKHTVKFVFRPRFLAAGIALSCLGLLILISGSIVTHRRFTYESSQKPG